MIVPPGFRLPCFLQFQDHVDADAVLHAGDRIEEFQLQHDVGGDAFLGEDFRDAHQRGIADRLGDAVIDAATQRAVENERLVLRMSWRCSSSPSEPPQRQAAATVAHKRQEFFPAGKVLASLGTKM